MPGLLAAIAARLRYWWSLLWRGHFRLFEVGLALLALYDLILSQLIGPNVERPDELARLGHLFKPEFPWYMRAIGLLIIALAAALEGAYRDHALIVAQPATAEARRAIADRLASHVERGDEIAEQTRRTGSRVPDDEYERWKKEAHEELAATSGFADAAAFDSNHFPLHQWKHGALNTATWNQLNDVLAKIEVLREVIKRYLQ